MPAARGPSVRRVAVRGRRRGGPAPADDARPERRHDGGGDHRHLDRVARVRVVQPHRSGRHALRLAHPASRQRDERLSAAGGGRRERQAGVDPRPHGRRGGDTLGSTTITPVTVAANTWYSVSVRAARTGATTTLTAKLWVRGTAEPGAAQLTATDATAALQAPGYARLNSYESGASTAAITTSWDDLRFTSVP